MTKALARPRSIAAGVGAGLAGGVLLDLYLFVTTAHADPAAMAAIWTFVASVLIGKAAFAGGAPIVALGIVLHFVVAIGWGVGYALLADRTPQLITRPFPSGFGYGVLVDILMQFVQIAAGAWQVPKASVAFTGLIGHIVFYGLPVAYIVARAHRAR